jgi:hypothetical protein
LGCHVLAQSSSFRWTPGDPAASGRICRTGKGDQPSFLKQVEVSDGFVNTDAIHIPGSITRFSGNAPSTLKIILTGDGFYFLLPSGGFARAIALN